MKQLVLTTVLMGTAAAAQEPPASGIAPASIQVQGQEATARLEPLPGASMGVQLGSLAPGEPETFFDDKERGWFWYEEPPPPPQKVEVKQPLAAPAPATAPQTPPPEPMAW